MIYIAAVDMELTYQLIQYGYMRRRTKNRIAELRNAQRMTQQELADAVGAHWITISKLERGRMKLTTDWLEKLAVPLGAHPRDLLPDVDFGFTLAEPDRIYSARKLPAPKMAPIWLTIQDDTHEPLLHTGDEVQLLPLTNLIGKQRKNAEGRLAFGGPANDGSFGFLSRGEKAGRYDLVWFGNLVLLDNIRAADLYLVATITFRLDRAKKLQEPAGQQKLI
jgi:DNA-binding XRE family transcriptional regulator